MRYKVIVRHVRKVYDYYELDIPAKDEIEATDVTNRMLNFGIRGIPVKRSEEEHIEYTIEDIKRRK